MELFEETQVFVRSLRKMWTKFPSDVKLKNHRASYLDEEVSFKVRVNKPKRKKVAPRRRVRKARMKVVRKPYKDFASLTDRGKRNQSSKIKRNFSKGAILHAAKSLICKGGKVRHSDILIDQLERDPKYAELVNKEMKTMKPKKAYVKLPYDVQSIFNDVSMVKKE